MDSAEDGPVTGKMDRSSEVFLVQTVFVVVAGVCLLMRGYVKCFIVKINSLDDYLLYGAMLVYAAYSGVVIEGCLNGAMGRHPSLEISLEKAAHSLRSWYICMLLYPAITLAIRVSVCVLLFRLCLKRSYIWIIRINLVVTALVSTAFFFILVFQCSPPQYFWRQLYGDDGYCRNKLIVTYSATVYSVLSALSDWCLGLLPTAILWSVRINLRTKVAIAGLLSLGMIAGVVLLVRATYITRLEPGLLFLYESTDVAIWSVMEPALGIIAASVATFRPLFKGCGFGWSSRRRGHSTHYQLSQQRPLDRFTPPTSPRAAPFNHPFETIDDKSDPGGGSEQDFAIRKTVQIRVTSEGHEYPSNLGAARAAKKPDLPPTTLEVDLVFPRPNETHRRTWPFPIVFAIHGAKSLWPYHLLFKWNLENIERTENNTRGDAFEDWGDFEDIGLSTRYTKGEVPGDEDIFYYIASTGVIGGYRNTDFHIKWEAVLPANCSKGDEVPLTWQGDKPVFYAPWGFGPTIKGFARFQVSDDAPMDIALDSSCLSLEDTSFNDGERNTLRIGGTVTDSQCIFYDEENFRPEPNPCAVKVDSALASRVTETMLARSRCEDVSWPDEVDGPCLVEKEDEPSGAERRLVSRGVIISAGILLGALEIGSTLG